MIVGRISFFFLIYTFLISLGAPPVIQMLQLAALAISSITIMLIAFQRRTLIFPAFFLIFLSAFSTYLTLSLIVGLKNTAIAPSIFLRSLQNFLITFSLPLLGYSLVKLGIENYLNILKHIFRSALVFAVLKCTIVGIAFLFKVSVVPLTFIFVKFFGTAPTIDEIAYGVLRFMAPADFFLPIALYYALSVRTGWRRVPCIALLSICIFLSFSRFIWIEALFSFVVYFGTLPRKQIFTILVALVALAPIVGSIPMPLLERRFFSSGTAQSDVTRSIQYNALTEDIDQHFFLGHGFASFALNVIRNPDAPYTYEMQWVSLIFQTGVCGIFFLMGLAIFNVMPLFSAPPKAAIPVLLIYGLSLCSGFANPSLIGRSASVEFLFIWCFSVLIREHGGRRLTIDAQSETIP